MTLEVLCDGATPEQLEAGRRAANRVLMMADITLIEAYRAECRWHAWDDSGQDEAFEPTEEERVMLDLLKMAEHAANEAMGWPEDDPHAVLNWLES